MAKHKPSKHHGGGAKHQPPKRPQAPAPKQPQGIVKQKKQKEKLKTDPAAGDEQPKRIPKPNIPYTQDDNILLVGEGERRNRIPRTLQDALKHTPAC